MWGIAVVVSIGDVQMEGCTLGVPKGVVQKGNFVNWYATDVLLHTYT